MNDNNNIALFIGLLLEENHNRNFMRIERRRLRDQMNPFEMPDAQFMKMFRLKKQCTINLINALQQFLPTKNANAIALPKKVLITLNFLATGSFQNSVGSNTWLSASQPSVSRAVNEICSTIAEYLLPTWVQFPTTEESIRLVKQGFFLKYGFRGVLGAVDGTHVEILAPPENDINHPPYVYINRKGKHSINVMLISDVDCRILAVNARFPGSVHDSAVWQMSSIRNHLQLQHEAGHTNMLLIGDSDYPLEPWLFTPIAIPRNIQEEIFNRKLSSLRNTIERTNGILKGRFRCISRLRTVMYHPTQAAKIIYSCCVLHNICKAANMIDEDIEMRDENDDLVGGGNVDVSIHQRGIEARNHYIRNM
ncbi:putative nuclease HARBI1 isoform X2 [Coccinella septempunctata]|uniref:putative nuclease HARBI1 isoform X2 n=1 Tax=Coccinella septempunctata TaxID=41139 RepID=UPI001D08CC7A|nr:putative nuclease HARBI1 isoform X2 [Coccinella septempunctata]